MFLQLLNITTVIARPNVPSLACSRDPAVSARRKDIPLPSALNGLLTCARTVNKKVGAWSNVALINIRLTSSTGHRTMECTENRKFDLNGIPDKLPEEAWAAMKAASDDKDLGEFREVSQMFFSLVYVQFRFD